MKDIKHQKAFTIVELLIVIAIITVLSTVGIVGYSSFIDKAKESNDNTLLTQINSLLRASAVFENINNSKDAENALA